MAIIKGSRKLSTDQDEQCICSKGFVFFRIVPQGSSFKFMTATAAEDTGVLRPFPDQDRLLAGTKSVLMDRENPWTEKPDRTGRPYVETYFDGDADVLHVANTVLLSLGFDDFEVSCLREMKAIYEEFAVDDSGNDTYLSDGMSMTADGRLVGR